MSKLDTVTIDDIKELCEDNEKAILLKDMIVSNPQSKYPTELDRIRGIAHDYASRLGDGEDWFTYNREGKDLLKQIIGG